MKNNYCITSVLCFLLVIPQMIFGAFIFEKDGHLVIEAETIDLVGDWKVVDDASATYGKYLLYDGPDNYGGPDPKQKLSIEFSTKETGTYTLKWKVRQPVEHQGSDLANDQFIFSTAKINGISGETKFYGRSAAGNAWVCNGTFEPSSGHMEGKVACVAGTKYTLTVSGRSHGQQIDRIFLVKDYSGGSGPSSGWTEKKLQDWSDANEPGVSISKSPNLESSKGLSNALKVRTVHNKVALQFTSIKNELVTCTILDLRGKRLMSNSFNATKGMNSYMMDMATLPTSAYIIHLKAGNLNMATKLVN